jgi:hypothetical protein
LPRLWRRNGADRNNQHGDDLAVDANQHRAYIEDMERREADTGRNDMAWKPTSEYQIEDDLVQVLCVATTPWPADPEFPRACELGISSGDHADGEKFVSIGSRDEDGEWFVAGWDMTQDCWTGARCFSVLGWQAMPSATE